MVQTSILDYSLELNSYHYIVCHLSWTGTLSPLLSLSLPLIGDLNFLSKSQRTFNPLKTLVSWAEKILNYFKIFLNPVIIWLRLAACLAEECRKCFSLKRKYFNISDLGSPQSQHPEKILILRQIWNVLRITIIINKIWRN